MSLTAQLPPLLVHPNGPAHVVHCRLGLFWHTAVPAKLQRHQHRRGGVGQREHVGVPHADTVVGKDRWVSR